MGGQRCGWCFLLKIIIIIKTLALVSPALLCWRRPEVESLASRSAIQPPHRTPASPWARPAAAARSGLPIAGQTPPSRLASRGSLTLAGRRRRAPTYWFVVPQRSALGLPRAVTRARGGGARLRRGPVRVRGTSPWRLRERGAARGWRPVAGKLDGGRRGAVRVRVAGRGFTRVHGTDRAKERERRRQVGSARSCRSVWLVRAGGVRWKAATRMLKSGQSPCQGHTGRVGVALGLVMETPERGRAGLAL